MTFDELKEKAHGLPLKPGVYIMQNAKNEVIYVGKAKALKNRVSQYFANLASHTEKTRAMVSQIDHFDVIIADSAAEIVFHKQALRFFVKISAFIKCKGSCRNNRSLF